MPTPKYVIPVQPTPESIASARLACWLERCEVMQQTGVVILANGTIVFPERHR